MKSFSPLTWNLACVMFAALLLSAPDEVRAQKSTAKRDKDKAANVTAVDVRAQAAQDEFLRTAAELARDYEDLEEFEKAQDVLKTMLKLVPDSSQIQEKIDALEQTRISGNEMVVEVDASKGWTPTNVSVQKGKVIKFASTGEFRIVFNQTIGPQGISGEDVKTDLIANAPLGGVIGLIVDEKGKSSEPFTIGEGAEFKADSGGQVFVRVNVPPQSKCIGKLKVTITGDIVVPETASNRRP